MQRDEDRNLPNQLRALNLNKPDAQEPRPHEWFTPSAEARP